MYVSSVELAMVSRNKDCSPVSEMLCVTYFLSPHVMFKKKDYTPIYSAETVLKKVSFCG
jgi:hypothetical protein